MFDEFLLHLFHRTRQGISIDTFIDFGVHELNKYNVSCFVAFAIASFCDNLSKINVKKVKGLGVLLINIGVLIIISRHINSEYL